MNEQLKKILSYAYLLVSEYVQLAIRPLPVYFSPIKVLSLRLLGAHLWKGVLINAGVYTEHPDCLVAGNWTWIDRNVILLCGWSSKKGKKEILRLRGVEESIVGRIQIGKGCHIAPNVVIQAHGGVKIGNYIGIASNSRIYSQSHHYRKPDSKDDAKRDSSRVNETRYLSRYCQ